MTISVNFYVPQRTRARMIRQNYDVKTDTWYDVEVEEFREETDNMASVYKNRRIIIQEVN